MEKLKMKSMKICDKKVQDLKKLFPNVIVETTTEDGKPEFALDINELKKELNDHVLDDYQERYQTTWPDKKSAVAVANSQINKTLRPAVKESVNFDNTKNVYIEGDNLDVLKLLRETYLEKVKLIYIDPPYNAGADILYKNNYEMSEEDFKKANYDIDEAGCLMSLNQESCGRFHTDWMNMMYSRLKVARDLLAPDGCIVIAIDHNELVNLVKMCDEIFNEANRIGIITVVHKPEGRNQEKYFASSNEFALFYAKNKPSFNFIPSILDDEMLKEYDQSDEKGKYKLISAIAKNHGRDGYDKNLRENNPKNFYPIYVSPDAKEITLTKKKGYLEALPITKIQERTWRYIIPSFEEKLKQGEFVAKIENGEAKIYEKYRADKGQLIKTHWIDKKYNAMVYGTKLLDEIMKVKTFDFPKSLYLMEDILKLTTKENDLVLDFFSGSGTTAHAVMDLNAKFGGSRHFIMVQLPYPCDEKSEAYKNGFKTIPEIAKERLRRVGKDLIKEHKSLDIGFRVLKLDSSNMQDIYYSPKDTTVNLLEDAVDNIKSDRTPLDLLFQVMLDIGIDLSSSIEEKEFKGKKCFVVNEKELIACFDDKLDNAAIMEIAKQNPSYAVFRNKSFKDDSVSINVEQTFKTYSPASILKVI